VRSNATHNPSGFVPVTHVRCPDCEDQNALRSDGGAKIISGGQLQPATEDVGLTTAAAGCRTCGGRGALEIPKHDDPKREQKLQALLAAGYSLRRIEVDPYHIHTGWLVRDRA